MHDMQSVIAAIRELQVKVAILEATEKPIVAALLTAPNTAYTPKAIEYQDAKQAKAEAQRKRMKEYWANRKKG